MLAKNIGNGKDSGYLFPSILLIEDDEATAAVVQQFFQMSGYICNTISSGTHLELMLKELNPSLFIIDYGLPHVNGIDICDMIKRNLATSHIPVILYSAYSCVTVPPNKYSYDAFIAKPFDLDNLMGQVEQLLYA